MVKRAKTSQDDKVNNGTVSRIFHPYRAVGHVTTSVPIAVQLRGTEYFITASVGSAFQIYALSKLRLKFVSEPVIGGADILALAVSQNFTFVSTSAGHIEKFERAKRVAVMESNSGDKESSPAISMIIFGSSLVSVHDDNVLRVWTVEDAELHAEIPFDPSCSLSCAMHPSTYLNKIVVGSSQGRLQLWNIKTCKKIYEFKLNFGCGITCIEQSPVVDVVAIGLSDGRIALHNLKTDQTLVSFKQSDRVTAISFRTDEHHFMATASMTGEVAIWDLDEKRLVHVMNDAHSGSVQYVMYLHGKASMISSGSDNSIKQWMFDSLDGVPRLFRSRSGHHAPPTFIRYYDVEGKYLLSAGSDKSLRLFCTYRDEQNVELSQGSVERKAKMQNCSMDDIRLSQIVRFASSTTREYEWDNILSCHSHSKSANSWSFDRKAIGKFSFSSPDDTAIKCVAASFCGNFGYIGTSSGRIQMYNMQSGIHRRVFRDQDDRAHSKPVTDIKPDHANDKIMTSSLDGTVKIWDMHSGKLLKTVNVGVPVTQLELFDENNLLAIAADDFTIRLLDVDTCRVVREFHGHLNRITDMAFSPDGRWLITASLDSTVRSWDIPSGCLVDAFKTRSIPTSITFSPTGDFLISAHVNSVGLSMWTNKLQYSSVALRKLSEDHLPQLAEMPTIAVSDEEVQDLTDDDYVNYHYETPDQLADRLVTMSSEPRSKWHNLLNLETIKTRNKPKQPVTAPEKAPFFLPTVSGIEPKFVVDESKGDVTGDSQLINMSALGLETEFIRKLRESYKASNFQGFVNYMKVLSPSATDFEFKMIGSDNGYRDLQQLIEILVAVMESGRDFEILQAYMNAILKIHTDVFVSNPQIFKPFLEKYSHEQKAAWNRLNTKFQRCLCIMDFIK